MEYCGAGSLCDLMAICERTLDEEQIAVCLLSSLLFTFFFALGVVRCCVWRCVWRVCRFCFCTSHGLGCDEDVVVRAGIPSQDEEDPP